MLIQLNEIFKEAVFDWEFIILKIFYYFASLNEI